MLNGYRKHNFKLKYHFLFDRYNVLKKSSGLEDVGSMQIHLIICLFLAWAIIVLAVIRGVKTLGKVGTKQLFSQCIFYILQHCLYASFLFVDKLCFSDSKLVKNNAIMLKPQYKF